MTDVYREAAAQMFGCTPEEVTPPQRKEAKDRLFAEMYGGRKPSIDELADLHGEPRMTPTQFCIEEARARDIDETLDRLIDEGYVDDSDSYSNDDRRYDEADD